MIMPNIHTKNVAELDSSHIYSIVNENFDIDKILANQSHSVFGLDQQSLSVLQLIAKNGSLNEYRIADKIYNVSRDSVRRRIYGTTRIPSLLREKFLLITKSKKFKTGMYTKTFGLTLKGILTSLAKINFEKIYLICNHFTILKNFTNNKYNVVDFSILYAKYHIALVLSWYNMMDFDLTFQSEPIELFGQGMKNYFLYGTIPHEAHEVDWQNYLEIGKRLFVLEHTLIALLSKLTSDPSFSSNKVVTQFIKQRPNFLKQNTFRNLLIKFSLRDWMIYLDLQQKQKIDAVSIPMFEYGESSTNTGFQWISINSDMNRIKNKIFKKLRVRNIKDVEVGKIVFEKSKIK